MAELTLEERLLALAEELETIAECGDEVDYSELGDWFYSSGSHDVDWIATKIRRIAKEIK